jgi:transposase-like protein
MKQVIALLAVIVLGGLWIRSEKAKVAYADTDCPVCGSSEVLDFGQTERGQHCHCYDCGQEFYLETASDYE